MTQPDGRLQIWGLQGMPEIRPGDDLCREILQSLDRYHRDDIEQLQRKFTLTSDTSNTELAAVFVVAQKIVSKSEGRVVELDDVVASPQAAEWSRQYQRDPRMVELVLREAKRVVRMDRGVLIVETYHGYICANGGVDASNAPEGSVILLPKDPDASARRLCRGLEAELGMPVAVIISDTFGRPWRQGLANVALGIDGLSPFIDYRGQLDSYGRPLHSTVLAVADELAAAAELVMGKVSGVPVALIQGFRGNKAQGSGRELLRPPQEDLFR